MSYLALGVALSTSDVLAQDVQTQSGASMLAPVVVVPPKPRKRHAQPGAAASDAGSSRAVRSAARAQPAQATPKPADTFEARTGTSGYFSNSTSVAMKTNTPLLNIPQSLNVVTKDFIKDQSFQGLTDVTRYVPGVAIHQGEGNRDELVIRGVDSSANFFVNGFRDDVQYFRDLYNTQSIEILKGPSALIFGRGAGGGLVNRTLKEADGTRVYEATAQTGSYGDRRISVDAGQAINENVAARFNAFYEGSDTFRDFGKLERYGINPTVTLKPDDNTKVKLSYEYFHDERTADRGNPSQGLSNSFPSSTRFNPAAPFAPNGDLTAFFGSPTFNYAHADVQTGMAVIEHDFENGLTVKNSSIYADYNRGLSERLSGQRPAERRGEHHRYVIQSRGLQQHDQPRERVQPDGLHLQDVRPARSCTRWRLEPNSADRLVYHSGIQAFFLSDGVLSNTIVSTNPFDPTYFGNVAFNHTATDANSKYRLNVGSAYVQDQIEITRWLQLIAGARFDHFDLAALDQNTGILRSRVDDKISPRAGVILKPMDNVSVYGSYSISYLPASGDQFSALNGTTLILEPQKFDNKEVGVKWDILPKLQYTAALYQLDKTNVPVTNPDGSPSFFPSGKQKIRGFETGLNGYITADWQAALGYAYTDARVTSQSTPAIVVGNRVQLVPYNTFSLWNKYQFNPAWAAGVGVIYFGDSYASSDDSVRLPGFVRVDAAVYYKFNEQWRAQLNVENIFNKGYWASADGNNNISPGQPRTFRVSATAKF